MLIALSLSGQVGVAQQTPVTQKVSICARVLLLNQRLVLVLLALISLIVALFVPKSALQPLRSPSLLSHHLVFSRFPTISSDLILACAKQANCSTSCTSPISGATCTDGVWVYTGNVQVSALSEVYCPLKIVGDLTGSSSSNLQVHVCAKITVTGAATLAGALTADVYGVTLTLGNRY